MTQSRTFVSPSRRYIRNRWLDYDDLPAPIKEALQCAVIDWGSGSTIRIWRAEQRRAPPVASLDLDDFLTDDPTPDPRAAITRTIAAIRQADTREWRANHYTPQDVPPLFTRIADNPCPLRGRSLADRTLARLAARQERFARDRQGAHADDGLGMAGGGSHAG